jgi:hypothetical protein
VNGLFDAADQVQTLCWQEKWAFCFIGGLAVQRWGEPRLTRDVDLTLLVGFGDEHRFVDRLATRFDARVDNLLDFARRTRVVLLRTAEGVPIDVALGALPFEERSVQRSSDWRVDTSMLLRTCSAEDLVVHKVFAGRDRDWADLGGIVARNGSRLDRQLIEEELDPLLELKDDPAAMERLNRLFDRDR